MSHSQYQTDGAIDRLSQYLEGLPHSQFRTTLLAVNRKFLPALRSCKRSQKEYYFYICDHISAITRMVELFSPVPLPQFIRDPAAGSWLLILVEPILLFALDESVEKPLNAARTTYYTEICVFLSNTISQYRKTPCFYKDFVERIWDLLTEVLQETRQTAILKYTFSVLHAILSRIPLCADLVCKVVLLRATTLDYGSLELVELRLMHCKMFHVLILRSSRIRNQQYLDDLRAEMIRCMSSESDSKVVQALLKILPLAKMPEQVALVRSIQDFQSVDHFFDHPNNTESSLDESVAQLVLIASSGTPFLHTNRSELALRKPPVAPALKFTRTPTHHRSWLSLTQSDRNRDRDRGQGRDQNPHYADTTAGYKEFDESLGRVIVNKLRQWRNSVFVGSAE